MTGSLALLRSLSQEQAFSEESYERNGMHHRYNAYVFINGLETTKVAYR